MKKPRTGCLHVERICAEPQSPFQEPHKPVFTLVFKLLVLAVGLGSLVCMLLPGLNDVDEDPWLSCLSSGLFWACFYLLLLHTIIDHHEPSRQKLPDGSTKAEILVSLWHHIGLCGGLLLIFLGRHVDNVFGDWWRDGPVYAFTLERQVQVHIHPTVSHSERSGDAVAVFT